MGNDFINWTARDIRPNDDLISDPVGRAINEIDLDALDFKTEKEEAVTEKKQVPNDFEKEFGTINSAVTNTTQQQSQVEEPLYIPFQVALTEILELNLLAMRIISPEGQEVQMMMYNSVVKDIEMLMQTGQKSMDYRLYQDLRNHILKNVSYELSGKQM